MNNIKFIFALLLSALLSGCKYESVQPSLVYSQTSNYPPNIADIIVPTCAVSGCHNTASAPGAAGLDLTTIQTLFAGSTNGAVVIPYAGDLSPMMYFVNTYNDLGTIHLVPTMPYNLTSLSYSQVQQLYTWIAQGAPDKNGFVMFSDNPNRMKFYVANQGCDEVAVFDAQSKVIMRYVSVGTGLNSNGGAEPHQLRISPDGKYWYPVFYNAQLLQKFSTSTDQLIGSCQLGTSTTSSYSSMCITSDSKYGFLISFAPKGSISYVNLQTMQFIFYIGTGENELSNPHGSYLTKDNNTLYVTEQYSHDICKIDVSNPASYIIKKISLQPGVSWNEDVHTPDLDPHEIRFSPDESKFFVTCQDSDQVRIFQTSNDSLLSIIQLPAGSLPQEIAVDSVHHNIYVSCQNGPSANGWEGEIAIIDYNTNTLIKELTYGLFQPHGIAIDEDKQRVYVASLNSTPNGPPPHHVGICGGRNGWVNIIDMSTLDFLPYQNEVLTSPYWVEYRH